MAHESRASCFLDYTCMLHGEYTGFAAWAHTYEHSHRVAVYRVAASRFAASRVAESRVA